MEKFSPEELWKQYKKQPWWVKVLAFIPLLIVLVIAIALFVVPPQELKVTQTAIKQNKKKTDNKVKQFHKDMDKIENEIKEVQSEQKDKQKEIENAKEGYGELMDRIDNADVDELSSISNGIRQSNNSRVRAGGRGPSSSRIRYK